MGTNSEKLVKQTIKLIAKNHSISYSELKVETKKIIRNARNFDEQTLGMMEELLDLSGVASEEELYDYDIEVLKMFCKIKEIEVSDSENQIRNAVWKHFEEEFEVGTDFSEDSEEFDESEGEEESDGDSCVEEESVVLKVPDVPEVPVKVIVEEVPKPKSKKEKKVKVALIE